MKNNILFFLLLYSNHIFTQNVFTSTKSKQKNKVELNFIKKIDIHQYFLDLEVFPSKKSIIGSNEILFSSFDTLPIRLKLIENYKVDSILFKNSSISYKREGENIIIPLPGNKKDSLFVLKIFYHGKPIVAKRAPWDGGFVWEWDNHTNNHWIGLACQGIGASSWFPCIEDRKNEPDSVKIRTTVPAPLKVVSNGQLISSMETDTKNTFLWKVTYPINNYNITLNIAEYVQFEDWHTYKNGKKLHLDYWVLPHNLEKAKTHFKQTHKMLEAYAHYFDVYPFINDGFCLVESPYPGMEHQSAIAYGNKYQQGYLGKRGLKNHKWDYIIIHESGHEYFGNSISCNDDAELWIHESFTTYMESLYVEYWYNKDEALKYIASQKKYIINQKPIIGPLGQNYSPDIDIYFKGSHILNTIRSIINNDKKWWALLKTFYNQNKLSNIVSDDFFNFLNDNSTFDFAPFIAQYFYTKDIPILEYNVQRKGNKVIIKHRWTNVIKGFEMPISFAEGKHRLYTTEQWQTSSFKLKKRIDFKLDLDRFYYTAKRIN